jgi:hypothetical protein
VSRTWLLHAPCSRRSRKSSARTASSRERALQGRPWWCGTRGCVLIARTTAGPDELAPLVLGICHVSVFDPLNRAPSVRPALWKERHSRHGYCRAGTNGSTYRKIPGAG